MNQAAARPLPRRAVGHPSLLLHTIGLTLAFCGAAMLVSAAFVDVPSAGASDDWLILGTTVGIVVNATGYVLLWKRTTSVPDRIPLLDVFATVAGTWVLISLIGTTALPVDRHPAQPRPGPLRVGVRLHVPPAPPCWGTGGADPAPLRRLGRDPPSGGRSPSGWVGWASSPSSSPCCPSIGEPGDGDDGGRGARPDGGAADPPGPLDRPAPVGPLPGGFTVVVFVTYLTLGMRPVRGAWSTPSPRSRPVGSHPTRARWPTTAAPAIEWAAVVFMFLAGTSFPMLYRVLRGRPGPLLRSVEFRTYLCRLRRGHGGDLRHRRPRGPRNLDGAPPRRCSPW